MRPIHHFYLTFNPFLNLGYEKGYTQAHEFYDLLRGLVSKDKSSSAWWGKIIAKDRDPKVDVKSFENVLNENQAQAVGTHLYVTDYQNLWVGKIKSISSSLPQGAHTLPFYADKKTEVWFEISDFFLIEHESEETAHKLSELFIDNPHCQYKIDGLSPFTTGIRFPCVVQDMAEEQYFDDLEGEEISHLVLKDNPAVTKSTMGHLVKSIHLYLFPEEMYAKFPHAAKIEIEAAELDMFEGRHHNLQQITFSYLKALELILNDLIIHHIKKRGLAQDFFVDSQSSPPKLYLEHVKDYFVTLKSFNKSFSIGTLMHFLERATSHGTPAFKQAFAEHKKFIAYCTKELAPLIEKNGLIGLRNSLAHGEKKSLTVKDAMAVRALVLGCGTTGILYNCYRTFWPEKFQSYTQVGEVTASQDEARPKLKLVG